ncbi:MAG: MATE family efflux transporter [Spirochaetales bacterium]|nr:MATE family efflux transporter [Spirochaetales bacterium]
MKFAVPAIMGMLVMALYNVVDTIFVGKLGTSAIGATAVAFPIYMLIVAIGQTFGAGAASYISRLLGMKKKDEADRTASTAIFSALILAVFFTITGLIFLKPMLRAFGATDTILPFALAYTRIILAGSVFGILNMTMNNMLRAEGAVLQGAAIIAAGAVLNIILDPIFIFGLNLGIRGAAIATIISQFTAFSLLIIFHMKNKGHVRISIRKISPSKSRYAEIIKVGLPVFIYQLLSSISLGLINTKASVYGGDQAVAAMGITCRIFMVGMFVVLGYSMGFQPIAGYNYGAGLVGRVRESVRLSVLWTTIFTAVFGVIAMIFSHRIASWFSIDPMVIKIASRSLFVWGVVFPVFGFISIYSHLFLALGKGKEGGILAISRVGIFFIPAILIMPRLFGLDGVIFSQPAADLLSALLATVFAFKLRKELGQNSGKTMKLNTVSTLDK